MGDYQEIAVENIPPPGLHQTEAILLHRASFDMMRSTETASFATCDGCVECNTFLAATSMSPEDDLNLRVTADHILITNVPKGSICTTIMELGPQNHVIIVVHMDPLGYRTIR